LPVRECTEYGTDSTKQTDHLLFIGHCSNENGTSAAIGTVMQFDLN